MTISVIVYYIYIHVRVSTVLRSSKFIMWGMFVWGRGIERESKQIYEVGEACSTVVGEQSATGSNSASDSYQGSVLEQDALP